MIESTLFAVSVKDQLLRARRSRARYEVLLGKGQASPIEVQDAREKEAHLKALLDSAPEPQAGREHEWEAYRD